MNRRTAFTYFGLPILYAAILLLLLFLQFAGGNLLSDSLGSLSLSGVFELQDGESTEAISSLKVEMNGFLLVFDQNRTLRLSRQVDESTPLTLTGYAKRTDGFDLQFERGVVLEVRQSADAQQMTIQAKIPSTLGVYRGIVLPYETGTGARAEVTVNYPGLDVDFRGSRYILALPPRSVVREDSKELLISADMLSQNIRYTKTAAGNQDLFDLWFQNQVGTMTASQYNSEVQQFIDAAWLGWKGSRFNSADGTWSHRNGQAAFNEAAATAVLAEAWLRDDYPRTFADVRSAGDLHRDSLTFKSSVFLGNLRQMSTTLETVLRPQLARITQLLNQRSADLFTIPEVFQTIVNHGTQQLVDQMLALLDQVNPQTLTATQATGLLTNLWLHDMPLSQLREARETFHPLIESAILPMMIRVEEGFFLQSAPGISDSLETLAAGRMFVLAGSSTGDERLVNLGRHMVVSILNLADGSGFVPERIEFTAGAISSFSRFRGPEDFYFLISTNPHLPKEYSLYPYQGAGSFFYSILNITSIDLQQDRIAFDIQTTPNRTHYVLIRGLPPVDPLSGMQLFGITYRDASDFENYGRGRFYNTATRVLMIKYFDDLEREKIIVYR